MSHPNNTTKSLNHTSLFFFGIIVLLLASLAFIAVYEPHSAGYSILKRSWGFDNIVYFGFGARLFFFGLLLLLIVPYSNQLLFRLFTAGSGKLSRFHRFRQLVFLLLSLVAFFFFYSMQVKYFFLGDFDLRMIQTMKKEFVSTEYLTMNVLYQFATAGAKAGFSHETMFRIYSCLAGSVYVYLSCLVANLSGKNIIEKMLLFLTLICTSLLLLFCGYVEIYATPVVLMLLYIYSALVYLKDGKRFLFTVIILGLAIWSHLLCLAALPSLFVIWYFRNKDKAAFISKSKNHNITMFLFLLVSISILVALNSKSGFLLRIVTPRGQPGYLTLFSYKHFWELFNGLFLCSGLSIFFIFILLWKAVKRKIILSAKIYFLLAITGCSFLIVFMADLQRGSGDWDIMSFPAITLNLVTALLVFHIYSAQIVFARYLIFAIAGINAINAYCWIEINHTDKSIAKIETMLKEDPANYYIARIKGPVQLAIAYKNNKLYAATEKITLASCHDPLINDLRACLMYGQVLQETNRPDAAAVFYEDLLLNRSQYVYEAYLFLLAYFEQKRDRTKVLMYLNLMFDSFIEEPKAFIENINFKTEVSAGLFNVLYEMETFNKADPKRLEMIKNVAQSVKEFKLPGR